VTTFDNLGTGVYTISGRNSGCVVNETVTLTAPDRLELTITPKDEICERGDGSLTFVTNGGTAPFTYAVNNIPVSSAQLFALSAGYYNVAVTDANGCTASNSATLNNIILPAVEILNHDTTINIGETVHLYAINAPDYVWTPAEGLSCTNCSSPVARPLQQTTYVVNTVSGLNCEPTAMVTIYVNTHLSLFVPTAFTPNNDGVNDYFRVKAKGVEVFKLMVYNRWGQLLFTSNDPNKGWDGFYQHELQPAGGYVYLIEYAYYGASDKILQKQGAFTLVR
jgi:gliding motility-associated-like protein